MRQSCPYDQVMHKYAQISPKDGVPNVPRGGVRKYVSQNRPLILARHDPIVEPGNDDKRLFTKLVACVTRNYDTNAHIKFIFDTAIDDTP